MKISACLIVKNEAKNIRKCLDSIKNIVQQIIVVDTGSTDDTVAIAKSYGAEIYNYQWNNDFAAAKNTALAKVKGDWFIFLDADEYFSAESIDNVPKLIEKHKSVCDGILTQMVNIDTDRNDMILDRFFTVRIFRNDPNVHFVGKVHEQIQNRTGRKNAWYKVEPNEIEIIHTGYSLEKIKEKCKRNLAILEKQLEQDGDEVDLYRYFADTYYGLEDYDQTIKYARLDIATGRKEVAYASRSYRLLIGSLKNKKSDAQSVEAALKEAIAAFPELPDFYAEYALLFYEEAKYEEAICMGEKAFALNENYNDIETRIFDQHISTMDMMLANIYRYKNDYAKALQYYKKILQRDRYCIDAFVAIYRMFLTEQPVQIIALLNGLYDIANKNDLRFLIHNISGIKRTKVLAYYLRMETKLLQKNSFEIMALECVGNYAAVKNNLVNGTAENINFTACAAILLNDYSQLNGMIHLLPDEYKRIILRYYQQANVQLNTNDFVVYKALLLGLMNAKERVIIQQYCDCALDFELIQQIVVAKLLKDKCYFLQAQKLYQSILAFEIIDGKSEILYDMAICCYSLGEYREAKDYLNEVNQLGFKGKEVAAFLAWTDEKLLNIADRMEE